MREGHEIASSPPLLAMTKGMRHCQPFFIVIASVARQSQEKQNSKIKGQNDRAKFGDVVRGFSLVHDPEGSHYKSAVSSQPMTEG